MSKLNTIVFVTGSMKSAGAEKQLYILIKSLQGIVENIHMICFGQGPMYERYESLGVKMTLIDKGKGVFIAKLFKIWFGLFSAINKIQPDLVHSQLPETNILCAFSLWFVPVPLLLSERGMGLTRPFWEKALRFIAYRRPNAFMTNSISIKERIIRREKVNSKKITIINNGVLPHVKNTLRSREFRYELQIGDTTLLTTVGRLSEVKGYHFLLEAFSKALHVNGNLKLVFVGDGPEKSSLERKVTFLGVNDNVCFLGKRNDVYDILLASDIYISSSFSEGQSNSILEAMAVSLPVIATAVGGTTDILADGVSGLLVQSGNVEELTSAILALSNDEKKRRKLGENSTKRIAKKHSLNVLREQYLELCYNVITIDKKGKHE